MTPEVLADLRGKAEEAMEDDYWDESALRRQWGEEACPPNVTLALLDRVAELERLNEQSLRLAEDADKHRTEAMARVAALEKDLRSVNEALAAVVNGDVLIERGGT